MSETASENDIEFYECIIILPIHLFKIPEDITYRKLFIVEHPLFFTDYTYHINKLILHRASMKNYAKETGAKYIDCANYEKKIVEIFKKYKTVAIFDAVNHTIYNDYYNLAKKHNTDFAVLRNPNFICSLEDILEYREKFKKPSHKTFYIYYRKKYSILLDKPDKPDKPDKLDKSKPLGGKWSFDKENRLKFPDDYKETEHDRKLFVHTTHDNILNEAIKYAKSIADPIVLEYLDKVEPFYLPYEQEGTKKYFDKFIKNKLDNFGPYEDAARDDVMFGYHSVLSPLLNVGLICPSYIIEKVEKVDCRIESKEGYIRQLFWREYCRYMYMTYRDELTLNKTKKVSTYFKDMNTSLKKSWFDCSINTGMSNVDACIQKFAKYGYLHHIERLMHVGNFMLLNNVKPKEVYVWFMMFIDAYPWVMIPNIYGMSQYVPGSLMMNRPYFSSSNYIKNMSNFKSNEITIKKNIKKKTKKGNTDKLETDDNIIIVKSFDVWDALFYRLISINKNNLSKNYSTANFVKLWKDKTKAEQTNILYLAEIYLKNYM